MSKLIQVNLLNGNTYATRVADINELYKEKVCKIIKGCLVNTSVSSQGQISTQLFDLAKNDYFSLPIYINPNCIVEVRVIKKNSDLEKLYHKVTSNIVTLPQNNKLN